MGTDIIVAPPAPPNLDIRVKVSHIKLISLKVFDKCACHLFPVVGNPYNTLMTSRKLPSDIMPTRSNLEPAWVYIFS